MGLQVCLSFKLEHLKIAFSFLLNILSEMLASGPGVSEGCLDDVFGDDPDDGDGWCFLGLH